DAFVSVGELEGVAAVLDARPDREDPRHAGLGGSGYRLVGIVERGQMRMRVDHAVAAGSSIFGKSGFAAAIPSTSSATPVRTRFHARSSGWFSAARMRGAVSGRNAESATARAVSPSTRL